MARPARIAGILLAAGSSTRMGSNKLLLEIDGETMLRRSARALLDAALDPVIVVLGHEAERLAPELAGLGCASIVNALHGQGQGASLHAGVKAASGAADALVLALADMPLVTAEMIAALVARQARDEPPLVVSRYGDVVAPPHLFSSALFEELLATDPATGARALVRRRRHQAAFVNWPESALSDVDAPADYERIRSLRR